MQTRRSLIGSPLTAASTSTHRFEWALTNKHHAVQFHEFLASVLHGETGWFNATTALPPRKESQYKLDRNWTSQDFVVVHSLV
jgi:hypothetical protein